jgi:DNA polymerase-3 subunit epsilon
VIRSPSLREEARRVLADGPAHTLDLARKVLCLRGNPGAASRAVFTLLGGDPAFRVNRTGVWTLDPGVSPPGPPLRSLSYAVVDVETTGGSWERADRVIEIAVVHVEAGAIGDAFAALVNPLRPIPRRIQAFTGITDEMVSAAPPFEGVAPAFAERLGGRIFVAHNAGFDWRFVSAELLSSTGEVPEVDHLCTVRLGRLLVPRLRSHGLDSLAAHFGIPIPNRHRALGDAMATARLLVHLLRRAEERDIRDLAALRQALVRRRGVAASRS